MGARKDTFMERRERIRELLDSVGRWNLNIAELARTFVVTRKTIYKDLHQICKGLDPDDLKKMSFDLAVGYKKGFNECMKILATSKDEKSRISAAGQIDTMSKGIINLLESYGYKEKIAEKVEASLQVDIWKDLQEGLENVKKNKLQAKNVATKKKAASKSA